MSEYRAWIPAYSIAAVAALGALLIASVVSIYVLVRLPADFLDRPRQRTFSRCSIYAFAAFALKNLLAVALVVVGVVLTLLPGPGLVTIAAGLALSDLPVGDRMLRKILERRPVLVSVNGLRRKFSRAPLRAETRR